MKSARQILRTARELLAGGWSEPQSTDAQGRPCYANDEGLSSYCLDDALRLAAGGSIEAAVEVEMMLQQHHRLNGGTDSLTAWLQTPSRTSLDVQRLLARVELHLLAKEPTR